MLSETYQKPLARLDSLALLHNIATTEDMLIQMFFHPAKPHIRRDKPNQRACPDSQAIEDGIQMGGQQTCQQRNAAKAARCEQGSIQILKVIQENDLGIH